MLAERFKSSATTSSSGDCATTSARSRFCRIECTSVMSGLGGVPAALPGVDAGRCRRRTGRDLVGAAGQPGDDLGDPGGVARGRSPGCRPIWAAAAVKRPFGELGPALAWRDDVRENGGALDGVRALPAKGKNFSCRGWVALADGTSSWANDVYRRTRRAAASREGCQSAADDIGKGKEIKFLATLTCSGPGGLRQDPGRAPRIVGRTKNGRRHGGTTCVCCCRRTGTR